MNIEKAKVVLEAIKNNKEKFDYSAYITVIDDEGERGFLSFEHLTNKEIINKCGTTACVAGWTCLLFYSDILPRSDYERKAQEVLDLSIAEEQFLFHMASGIANVDDAIARLEWLIAGNIWSDYDVRKESWNKDGSQSEIENLMSFIL